MIFENRIRSEIRRDLEGKKESLRQNAFCMSTYAYTIEYFICYGIVESNQDAARWNFDEKIENYIQ